MIVNIRGTCAAGKTTIVRSLIARFEAATPIYGLLGSRRPEAICIPRDMRPLYALGPYPAAGADAIISHSGVDGVIGLLEKYSALGDVIFEGLIISSMDGAIGKWLRKHPPTIIAVLNVTLLECAAGLRERQGDRPRRSKTQVGHHYATIRVANRMRAGGMRVEKLARDGAVDTILGWLP